MGLDFCLASWKHVHASCKFADTHVPHEDKCADCSLFERWWARCTSFPSAHITVRSVRGIITIFTKIRGQLYFSSSIIPTRGIWLCFLEEIVTFKCQAPGHYLDLPEWLHHSSNPFQQVGGSDTTMWLLLAQTMVDQSNNVLMPRLLFCENGTFQNFSRHIP